MKMSHVYITALASATGAGKTPPPPLRSRGGGGEGRGRSPRPRGIGAKASVQRSVSAQTHLVSCKMFREKWFTAKLENACQCCYM